MSRDKQIEEMARILCEDCAKDPLPCILIETTKMCDSVFEQVEALYNAGYRKASDVAREIFEEIENCFFEELVGCTEAKLIDEEMFAELKKKYTESSNEITEGGE